MKKWCASALCALALVGLAGASQAHGVYVADRLDQPTLVLGEGPYDNVYESKMVTNVLGFDLKNQPMPVDVEFKEHNMIFIPTDQLGTTVTFFDYGYFTKDKDGKLHREPIDQVKDAVKSTHAIKWNVNYWKADVQPMAIQGLPIQIVPAVNPLTLRKGDSFKIQVLKDGKPMANAPLIGDVINDLTNESKTDENGNAIVTVNANGLNVIGVEIAYPTERTGEQNKYFSSLSFTIAPE